MHVNNNEAARHINVGVYAMESSLKKSLNLLNYRQAFAKTIAQRVNMIP